MIVGVSPLSKDPKGFDMMQRTKFDICDGDHYSGEFLWKHIDKYYTIELNGDFMGFLKVEPDYLCLAEFEIIPKYRKQKLSYKILKVLNEIFNFKTIYIRPQDPIEFWKKIYKLKAINEEEGAYAIVEVIQKSKFVKDFISTK